MLRRSLSLAAGSNQRLADICSQRLEGLKAAGTFKRERELFSPQQAHIRAIMPGAPAGAKPIDCLNFSKNDYLGMANNKEVIAAGKKALDEHGFGMASVRFICGTNHIHRELERDMSTYMGTQDTIIYPSAFDANAGIFECLLTPEDVILSDALCHASIVDGVRLCKAQRQIFKHLDMVDLEEKLKAASGARIRWIVNDGVYSMDGDIAPVPKLVELAEKYDACIMLDDCHATGVIGPAGRGSAAHFGVPIDKIAITNGTLGKALGGASGGYSTGLAPLVQIQRQASRPYLFSNAVAPVVVAGSHVVLDKLMKASAAAAAGGAGAAAGRDDPFARLQRNTECFRTEMAKVGLRVLGDKQCPICPVWVGDAAVAAGVADRMMQKHGIFVIAFSYPVVPKEKARIRVQLSADHTEAEILKAVAAFAAEMPKGL
jgi:glycine C-acetyltransferase